jgi:hypothetical protein
VAVEAIKAHKTAAHIAQIFSIPSQVQSLVTSAARTFDLPSLTAPVMYFPWSPGYIFFSSRYSRSLCTLLLVDYAASLPDYFMVDFKFPDVCSDLPARKNPRY